MRSLAAVLGIARVRNTNYVHSVMSACLGLSSSGLVKLVGKIEQVSGSVAAMCPLDVKARALSFFFIYKLDLAQVSCLGPSNKE